MLLSSTVKANINRATFSKKSAPILREEKLPLVPISPGLSLPSIAGSPESEMEVLKAIMNDILCLRVTLLTQEFLEGTVLCVWGTPTAHSLALQDVDNETDYF